MSHHWRDTGGDFWAVDQAIALILSNFVQSDSSGGIRQDKMRSGFAPVLTIY
uniref:hypothetical protein n=1 Tax=Trichocoleus desertorum TaxID=1481672 RepID=UPI0025B3B509|nr:hypothetical protein [Trichocoleus desertorum]